MLKGNAAEAGKGEEEDGPANVVDPVVAAEERDAGGCAREQGPAEGGKAVPKKGAPDQDPKLPILFWTIWEYFEENTVVGRRVKSP